MDNFNINDTVYIKNVKGVISKIENNNYHITLKKGVFKDMVIIVNNKNDITPTKAAKKIKFGDNWECKQDKKSIPIFLDFDNFIERDYYGVSKIYISYIEAIKSSSNKLEICESIFDEHLIENSKYHPDSNHCDEKGWSKVYSHGRFIVDGVVYEKSVIYSSVFDGGADDEDFSELKEIGKLENMPDMIELVNECIKKSNK